MALRAVLTSLDEVPEALRGLYVEQEGRFVLDLEGLEAHPATRALKSALESEREARRKANGKVAELTAALAARQGGEAGEGEAAPEEGASAAAPSERPARQDAADTGQIETLKGRVAELERERAALDERLAAATIDNAIREQAINAGVRPGAIRDVLARARELWRLKDAKPVPVNPDGSPVLGKNGAAALTIEEWIARLAEEAPFLFEANQGGGAGGSEAGMTLDGVRIVPAEKIGQYIEEIATGTVRVGA